jgi:anti-sigma factor RsiW
MDTLLRRYLDGELSEEEAARFLDRLASDPQLEQATRECEAILALGKEIPAAPAPDHLADGVMAAVHAAPAHRPAPRHAWWRRPLPLAASWVLALGLGYVLAQLAGGGGAVPTAPHLQAPGGAVTARVTGESGPAAATDAAGMADAAGAAAASRLQLVRLVYAPQRPDVARVRVAGSFNGWDPDRTPMRRVDGQWVADLALPPGTHEYMFVVGEDTWVTDPLAPATRDDGFGSRNALLQI